MGQHSPPHVPRIPTNFKILSLKTLDMTPYWLVNNSYQRLVVSSFRLIVTEFLLSTA
jgi:hypothetical protein